MNIVNRNFTHFVQVERFILIPLVNILGFYHMSEKPFFSNFECLDKHYSCYSEYVLSDSEIL